jgi:hypothetical protein
LRKSEKIATTPTRGPFAVVMPSTKASKREQANAKKIKQVKKEGAGSLFWLGTMGTRPITGGHSYQCGRTTKRE